MLVRAVVRDHAAQARVAAKVLTDAKVVAVAPFRVSGADPSLSYLRAGMVDLLAAKLGGTAGTSFG